ncbi:hypothetical protein KAX35_01345, partial [candidate division WOR-3 bacterium]|nr:hypothetical protein [candidate division WOR-3 bacterium]
MTSVGGQDIAIDSLNNIYLVWLEGLAGMGRSDIYFTCVISDAVSKKVNISDTPDNVSNYSDITVDPNGNIQVVWSEGFPMDEIYYTCYSQTLVDEQNGDIFYVTEFLQSQPNPFRERTVIS